MQQNVETKEFFRARRELWMRVMSNLTGRFFSSEDAAKRADMAVEEFDKRWRPV